MEKKDNLNVALVMCPGWGVVQPPVGISYLKGFLENNGVPTKCFDLSIELYKVFPEKKYWDLNYPEHFITPRLFEKDILPALKKFLSIWAGNILEYNPQVVGFSLFMSSINVSLLLARYLKQANPDIIILGGGPEVTRIKRVLIDGIQGFAPVQRDIGAINCFDALIDGEGEETFLEILAFLKEKKDFYNLDGVIRISRGNLVANNPRQLIKELDVLPPADYSDFNLESYTKRTLPLVTSRGCVNRCTFCADSPLWKNYRYRSPEKVLEEIESLIERTRVNQFEIADSTFNGDIKRVEEICDLIIAAGLNIQWSAKAAFKKGMDFAFLKKMKDAGCVCLSYGVESGSPSVLEDMRKNIDLAEAKTVLKHTCKAGILANCFFLIGYPTETEADFQLTLDFIEENAKFISRFDQVTGCHIEEDSYLGLNLDKYGIIFKEDGWHSKESTPEIRTDRLGRFKEFARKLHKHYKCEVQA